MPLPITTPSPPPITIEPTKATTKRTLVSRFDIEPSLTKRLKTDPQQEPSTNPLSDSDDSESVAIMDDVDIETFTPSTTKKKKKSKFQKYGEIIGQTKEELQRRDRRMQRFSEIEGRGTPPRVDTPDYAQDAQIVASIVTRSSHHS
jgi:hypothetical protein